MVRHGLFASGVAVEFRRGQLQLLGDELDEGRQIRTRPSEDLAQRQPGVTHKGELDCEAETIAVFTPSFDQGEVTRSETVASGQGVAFGRDTEELGALVGAQEVTSAHRFSLSTVQERSEPIMDGKA